MIWGAVLIAGGVFIGVDGELLFKFVLAVIGFLVGFSALFLLLDEKSLGIQIVTSVVAGGIGALVLYKLFAFGLYVAGGALGAVAGLVIAGLFGLTSGGSGRLTLVLVSAGTGGAGFGPRLGAMIIPLGTSVVAALMMVYGYLTWFQSTDGMDATEPADNYSRKSLLGTLRHRVCPELPWTVEYQQASPPPA